MSIRSFAPIRHFHGPYTAILAVVALAASLAGLSGTASAQQGLSVSENDGLITIKADSANAEDLADAIGEATGINVVLHGDPSYPMSAEIEDMELEKAIAEIAPSHLLVRESAEADAEIIEIVLMMPDAESGSSVADTSFLPSGEPADGVISQDQPAQVANAPDNTGTRELVPLPEGEPLPAAAQGTNPQADQITVQPQSQ